MVELADTLDLGSSVFGREGSSPSRRTWYGLGALTILQHHNIKCTKLRGSREPLGVPFGGYLGYGNVLSSDGRALESPTGTSGTGSSPVGRT